MLTSFLLIYTTIFFFFNATATTEIYTLSLHDALPILPAAACGESGRLVSLGTGSARAGTARRQADPALGPQGYRSEEHTSELQSHVNLVCRLLLEKKKKKKDRQRALPNLLMHS